VERFLDEHRNAACGPRRTDGLRGLRGTRRSRRLSCSGARELRSLPRRSGRLPLVRRPERRQRAARERRRVAHHRTRAIVVVVVVVRRRRRRRGSRRLRPRHRRRRSGDLCRGTRRGGRALHRRCDGTRVDRVHDRVDLVRVVRRRLGGRTNGRRGETRPRAILLRRRGCYPRRRGWRQRLGCARWRRGERRRCGRRRRASHRRARNTHAQLRGADGAVRPARHRGRRGGRVGVRRRRLRYRRTRRRRRREATRNGRRTDSLEHAGKIRGGRDAGCTAPFVVVVAGRLRGGRRRRRLGALGCARSERHDVRRQFAHYRRVLAFGRRRHRRRGGRRRRTRGRLSRWPRCGRSHRLAASRVFRHVSDGHHRRRGLVVFHRVVVVEWCEPGGEARVAEPVLHVLSQMLDVGRTSRRIRRERSREDRLEAVVLNAVVDEARHTVRDALLHLRALLTEGPGPRQ
jgi:hypothetical protein